MNVYQQIVDDCYWDSRMTATDVERIINSKDRREKQKLFSKILYNSRDKLQALKLFSKEELGIFFHDFKITYNVKYITRHFLVLKSLLLDEKVYVKGLEWKR